MERQRGTRAGVPHDVSRNGEKDAGQAGGRRHAQGFAAATASREALRERQAMPGAPA